VYSSDGLKSCLSVCRFSRRRVGIVEAFYQRFNDEFYRDFIDVLYVFCVAVSQGRFDGRQKRFFDFLRTECCISGFAKRVRTN
jgi:hypothetical protein